jgi:hypothetical protein
MIVQPGLGNAADYVRNVPATVLIAHGIQVAAMYAKYWDPAYVAVLHAAGVGTIAICEGAAGDALLGAWQAQINATRAITDAQRFGIPAGETIVYTHDTGDYTPQVPEYFKRAEDITRGDGYGFGGYIMKDPANACIARGVVFDLIWATAAWKWGGGRHPDSHVWQRPSGNLPGTLYNADLGDVQRPFHAWLPGSEPTQPTQEEDSMDIVTNSETFLTSAPNVAKFVVKADGSLRHITYTEWLARGSLPGNPLTTAQILELGAS